MRGALQLVEVFAESAGDGAQRGGASSSSTSGSPERRRKERRKGLAFPREDLRPLAPALSWVLKEQFRCYRALFNENMLSDHKMSWYVALLLAGFLEASTAPQNSGNTPAHAPACFFCDDSLAGGGGASGARVGGGGTAAAVRVSVEARCLLLEKVMQRAAWTKAPFDAYAERYNA